LSQFLLIIPVYNEKTAIVPVVSQTLQVIDTKKVKVLFINDGSTDGSYTVLEEVRSKYKFIEVVHKKQNEGYGAALITGFDYGIYEDYEYLITMDCDAQHEPKDLPKFMTIDLQIDVLSGSRYLHSSKSFGTPPGDRVEINQKLTQKLNKKYHLNLTDSFCGYKRYKTEALYSHDFTEIGYAFPLEFWLYAYSKKLSIQEIAVDKIYLNNERSFGEAIDKKRKRYRYYIEALQRAEDKYICQNA
jgi:glycosyltransferase involved in cell wall biosynthesis